MQKQGGEIMEQQDETTERVPVFSTKYKITLQDFISFNWLIQKDQIAKRKSRITKYLVLISILEPVYYAVVVRNQDMAQIDINSNNILAILLTIWCVVFLDFIYIHFIFKSLLKFRSKKMYCTDEYSTNEVELKIFEDGLEEIVTESNSTKFQDIAEVYSNKDIYAVFSKQKRTFIIPQNAQTQPIIEFLNKKLQGIVHNSKEEKTPSSTKDIIKEILKK